MKMILRERIRGQSWQNGRFVALKDRSTTIRPNNFRLIFHPGQEGDYLLWIQDYGMEGKKINIDLRTEVFVAANRDRVLRRQILELASSIAATAITFFFFLFTLAQYLSNRDRIYLYYTAYLLSMSLQFLKSLEHYGYVQLFFIHMGGAILYLEVIFDIIPFFFYAGFVQHFLELKKHDPRTLRRIKTFIWIVFALMLCSLLGFALGWYPFAQFIFASLWVIEVLGSIWFMLILYQRLSVPYAKYILLGSGLVLAGGAWSFLATILRMFIRTPWLSFHLLPLRIGFLAEVFFFSYTLGLRMKNTRLQRDLAEQKLAQNELDLLQTEIKALRAQINPHFVSNCLNSIKALIQEDRQEEAIDYLVRFSRLIRSVVDFSLLSEISLSRELELSRLYLEMEALRLGTGFQYQIEDPGEALDLEYVQVPPFLLQPFLENAIWHGLRQKEGEQMVKISFAEKTQGLICIIEDNGIGREKAQREKSKNQPSTGIRNVRERLMLLNRMHDLDLDIQIIDLYDQAGNASGTRVELHLSHL